MNILLTNDDGIHGEGLIRLKEALEETEDINLITLAPEGERSAFSHKITIFEPLIIKEVHDNVYTLNGSPADCIKIALDGFLKDKIDLVLSGINNGPNMGIDVYYSGTVAAAREGCFHNIPSIAFSLDGYSHVKDFEGAVYYAKKIIRQVMNKKLPENLFLNVNFPNIEKERVNGFQITILGTRVYNDQIIERTAPFGWKYFWIGGDLPTYKDKKDSDFNAVEKNYVSITPLQLDVTSYSAIEELKTWDL